MQLPPQSGNTSLAMYKYVKSTLELYLEIEICPQLPQTVEAQISGECLETVQDFIVTHSGHCSLCCLKCIPGILPEVISTVFRAKTKNNVKKQQQQKTTNNLLNKCHFIANYTEQCISEDFLRFKSIFQRRSVSFCM